MPRQSLVAKALPDAGAHAKDHVSGAIAEAIARMTPRDQAQGAAHALLAENSTIAKWVGIEALAAMKATEAADAVAALAGNRARLIGYWGEDSEGKDDPTLGQRAKQLSVELRAK
jgi:hypothetical protein